MNQWKLCDNKNRSRLFCCRFLTWICIFLCNAHCYEDVEIFQFCLRTLLDLRPKLKLPYLQEWLSMCKNKPSAKRKKGKRQKGSRVRKKNINKSKHTNTGVDLWEFSRVGRAAWSSAGMSHSHCAALYKGQWVDLSMCSISSVLNPT